MTGNLASLFEKYGTDKHANGYTGLYECLLGQRRFDITRLLEVGIGSRSYKMPYNMLHWVNGKRPDYMPGASLKVWRDWMPSAEVWGMDIAGDCMIEGEERITTVRCDSTDIKAVGKALEHACSDTIMVDDLPVCIAKLKQFDVIIDDGSHVHSDQSETLLNLWPHLRLGGIYVIEDLLDDTMWSQQHDLPGLVGNAPFFFARCRFHNVLVIGG